MVTKKLKKEKSWQRVLLYPIFAIFILGTISLLIISNWRTYQRKAELAARTENLKAEIEILEKRKQELEASALQVGQEDYLEKVAREQLNLKKPGEEVVAVLAPEEKEKKEEIQEEKSLWQIILEKIGF